MTDYTAELNRLLATQSATIAHHILADGLNVWVRKTGKTIPQWRYTLLSILSRSLNLGALQPVPNPGGRAALKIEARRLRQLSRHHIRVPRLLAEADNGLMFTHIGDHTLLHYIENSPDRLEYWQQGLDAIDNVHKQNQYLSQAFARNMIVCEDGIIGFIDFEDDPGDYLTIERCQSRDYLCYLHSTAIWLRKHNLLNQASAIWQQHQNTLSNDIATAINSSIKPINWMRHLQARKWGSDTLRLSALAALFTQNPPT
ncbi:hypothetical protein PL75_04485 [Neisseria arctica]|uniref:Serine/threonine protein kinase n=1 Tax=Neisseria arctica TaxID=1470200 RepID=A0A0J0YSU5_9NEIS|nr:hypothetical protein [Neisseria arctica]KLT73167.1 hypothetical protein PL75_04485 [Neisseria arctica]UOO87100.1 hypothetical protein LVJ86_02295 [Neisseria arctica]